jgi:hypothetical protein
MHYFGPPTITGGKIKEMVEKGYFAEGEAREPGVKMISKPDGDEAVVYEDFFVAGLRMPLHPISGDILLHFQAQPHQPTPNVMAQLLKYFWVVDNFRGSPVSNTFVKRYELHYQPKKVETPEGEMAAQYGYLNFHAKRDGGPKLSLAIKNKWSAGWMRYWFYCRKPCLCSSEGGKSVDD